MKNVYFIVDIDGTICDSSNRYNEVCKKFGKNYKKGFDRLYVSKILPNPELNKSFLEDVYNDKVIIGSEKILSFAERSEAEIIFLTGRSERFREITLMWLVDKFGAKKDVPLIMRGDEWIKKPVEDYKETVFVEKIYNQHKNSFFVFFDDDHKIINRFSKFGIVFEAPGCWDNLC
jgi:acid phosphatase class B